MIRPDGHLAWAADQASSPAERAVGAATGSTPVTPNAPARSSRKTFGPSPSFTLGTRRPASGWSPGWAGHIHAGGGHREPRVQLAARGQRVRQHGSQGVPFAAGRGDDGRLGQGVVDDRAPAARWGRRAPPRMTRALLDAQLSQFAGERLSL